MSADVFDDYENGVFKTTQEQVIEDYDEAIEEEKQRKQNEILSKSLRQLCHDTLPVTETLLRKAYDQDDAGLFAYYYNQYVLLKKFIQEEDKTQLCDLMRLFRFPLVNVKEQWKDYLPELVAIYPDYSPFVGVGKLKDYSRMDLSRPILYRLEHDMPELHLSELK